ncbi:MAG: hypothetical protein ACTIC1_01985 [Brevibacterium sp.]
MTMGVLGLLISIVYVCFGALILAILVVGLMVLLKVNRRLNAQDKAAWLQVDVRPAPPSNSNSSPTE